MQQFLQIRAGFGLRFDGSIEIIEGDIALFSLFGRLVVRGSLKSPNQIQLMALEGEVDISATFDTKSLVTYAQTDAYLQDVVINAEKFLATVIGSFFQIGAEISVSNLVILSENNSIMIKASKICADLFSSSSSKGTTIEGSLIEGGQMQNKSGNSIRLIASSFSLPEISNIADCSITIKDSRVIGSIHNQAGGNIDILFSDLVGQVIQNYAKGCITSSASRILAQI